MFSPRPAEAPAARLARSRLYAVTPDAEPGRVLDVAAAALRGGAGALQVRHKALARGDLLELAKRLRALTAAADALLIVNDFLDIAVLSGADGVHLGAGDLSVAAARRLAPPGFLVGASASTPESARSAVAAGADHLGCGPAFATPVKPGKAPIGPAGVAAVQAAVAVPVFAIGGIDVAGAARLAAAGVHHACVIRALSDAPDVEATARALVGALGGPG